MILSFTDVVITTTLIRMACLLQMSKLLWGNRCYSAQLHELDVSVLVPAVLDPTEQVQWLFEIIRTTPIVAHGHN